MAQLLKIKLSLNSSAICINLLEKIKCSEMSGFIIVPNLNVQSSVTTTKILKCLWYTETQT